MFGNYILHHLADMGEVLLKDGTKVVLKQEPIKDGAGIYRFSLVMNRAPYSLELDQVSLEEILKGAKAIIHGALI